MWKRTLRSHALPLAGTTTWSRLCMRSHRIPIAALLPRKLERRSENCGTCFTARSLTFIASSTKSMKGGLRCGCSRFATAQGESSNHPISCRIEISSHESTHKLRGRWECRYVERSITLSYKLERLAPVDTARSSLLSPLKSPATREFVFVGV